jgi:transcriptional regulator with XRE-family HTH domain
LTTTTRKSARALAIVEGRQLAATGMGNWIRTSAGLSLREVARAVDVDVAAVWHWEAGSKRPSPENAIAYRNFLNELRDAQMGAPRARTASTRTGGRGRHRKEVKAAAD